MCRNPNLCANLLRTRGARGGFRVNRTLHSCGDENRYPTGAVRLSQKLLNASNGWDWTENWNYERVTATLNALDELARITAPKNNPDVSTPILSTYTNGWIELLQSEERRQKLVSNLS